MSDFPTIGKSVRGWNAEMFKRLYQSGSKAMFTALTWYGDDGQLWIPEKSPDYYQNVEHAFETASNVVEMVNLLPGEKYIAGHSKEPTSQPIRRGCANR